MSVVVPTDIDRNIARLPDRDTAARLVASVASTSMPMLLTDAQGCVVWVNDAFTALSGYTTGDLAGRRPVELLAGPETDVQTLHWISEQLRAERAFTTELLSYRKTGESYWTALQVDPVRGDDGRPAGWLCIERDVTAARESAEALRRAQSLLLEAQRLARLGSWEWKTDGDVVQWSPELFHIYGIDPSQGAPSFASHDQLLEPTSLARLNAAVEEAVMHGTAYHLERLRIVRRDGTGRWVTARGEVIRDRSKQVIGLRGTLQDVTEAYEAERSRVELEEQLRFALDGSGDGIYDWDLRTNRVMYSSRWKSMLGYDDDDVGDSLDDWSSRAHPDDLPIALGNVEAHLRGETATYTVDMRMRRKDGAWHWIRSRGKVVARDQDGNAARFVGTHSDIQAEKQAESALRDARDAAEAATRSKSEFLARMSHELRTPLNSIIGFSQTVLKARATALGPRHADQLARVVSNGKHLLSLLNDVLDLAKIEAHRMTVEVSPFSLSDLLTEVRGMLEPLAQPGVAFLIDAPDDLVIITSDRSKLTQLLVNVIGNALKFTDQGSVRVLTTVHDTAVAIEVRDTGPGIPRTRLEAIFEAFEQGNGSTERRHGGTGLGLAISRQLVSLLGGTLTVDSEETRGAVFRIELPHVTAAATANAA
jgi:PAS domain S-box-containing protein